MKTLGELGTQGEGSCSRAFGELAREGLAERFRSVRGLTEKLCAPLETEDYVIQSMTDASPAKWHIAHVSWFFETMVLEPAGIGYQPAHPMYNFLFNSYYNSVGPQWSRPRRGVISRPTVRETYAYRHRVDEAMLDFIGRCGEEDLTRWAPVIELGLNHEQQHQELIVTDIKHLLAQNPLQPKYCETPLPRGGGVSPIEWVGFDGGVRMIGHQGDGFAYDNEGPAHREFLEPFALGSRLVTCGEYLEFMEDGGYERPEFWLSDGWGMVKAEAWDSPLYWTKRDGKWWEFTLHGAVEVEPNEPICHVSFYEADAYARWAGARLPRENEWEVASEGMPARGHFVEDGLLHPRAMENQIQKEFEIEQMFGDVWEWTQSPYIAYPGYRPAEGAIGEYNGKFMCSQLVLRGGSCATSVTHIRPTYRNFFPPAARWQFMGIRLAKDMQ